jgi:transcriptional regulator with XRE-family HTH domain
MTTQTNLRQLRKFLGKTQLEMADLSGCSRYMIVSIEVGRFPLSPRIAAEISKRTGVDVAWLMGGDRDAPMVSLTGQPYSLEDFERRQRDFHFSEGAHYRWRELQLGVGFDVLHRLLRASQFEGTVRDFMDRFEGFLEAELRHHTALEDTILGERRRAREAGMKAGKVIPLGLLTPADAKPFKRGLEKLTRAIAAVTAAEERREKRAKS